MDLKSVRAAKALLTLKLGSPPWLRGIGIGADPSGALRIQVYVAAITDEVRRTVPEVFQGVPVHLEEVGEIVPYRQSTPAGSAGPQPPANPAERTRWHRSSGERHRSGDEAMRLLHTPIQTGPKNLVSVSLSRPGANVLLLDELNWWLYQRGLQYSAHAGGFFQITNVVLRPPSPGAWHLVVDLGGQPGDIAATYQIMNA